MNFLEISDKLFKDASYRFVMEKAVNFEQSKSFLQPKYNEINSWRKETRQFVKDKLLYSPLEVPFEETIAEEVDFGEYTRQKVYFDSAFNCRIPAYLLIPKNLKKPAPGIVVLHDHGAQFYWGKEKSVEHKEWNPVLKHHIDAYYSGQPTASTLAKRGYVTLVIDSMFFGERRYNVNLNEEFRNKLEGLQFESEEYLHEYNMAEFEVESELVKTIYYAGHTFMGIRTWDDIASVSYLCNRPEVDPGRIGCIGLSGGGHRSGWLTAMDDRVKCAVIAGWMVRMGEILVNMPQNNPWMWVVPGLYGCLDYPDVVSLSAPKPLMVIHGKKDLLFVHGAGEDGRNSAEKAAGVLTDVYKKAGAEQNFKYVTYDGPHEFNAEMQMQAYSWLDMHLKNDLFY